jgi:hypothetical protein
MPRAFISRRRAVPSIISLVSLRDIVLVSDSLYVESWRAEKSKIAFGPGIECDGDRHRAPAAGFSSWFPSCVVRRLTAPDLRRKADAVVP